MRTFSIKFPDDQAAMVTELAAANGLTISDFIRDRVLASEDLKDAVLRLQSGLHAAIGEGFRQRDLADNAGPGQDANTALLLETVLLLRSLSNPLKSSAVFAEMKRLGVTPFTSEVAR